MMRDESEHAIEIQPPHLNSPAISFITSALETTPRSSKMEVHSDDSPAPLTEKHPPLVEESALSATTQDAESKPSWDFFIVVGSLFFGTFLVALDTTIIGTAVPAITSEFHTLDDIAWYGSGYLLSLTALQPTIGKLYKVLNIKGTYLSCVLVFEGM